MDNNIIFRIKNIVAKKDDLTPEECKKLLEDAGLYHTRMGWCMRVFAESYLSDAVCSFKKYSTLRKAIIDILLRMHDDVAKKIKRLIEKETDIWMEENEI